MSRRRVAWLVLGVMLPAAVLCILQPGFRYVVTVDVASAFDGKWLEFQMDKEPRLPWLGAASSTCLGWHNSQLVDVFHSIEGGPRTDFDAQGSVVGQGGSVAPPWPHSIPYTPAEVRQLIHEAKLFVQAAAQRGEVTLPSDWEYTQ